MKTESAGTYLHLVCMEPGEKAEVAPTRDASAVDWTDQVPMSKDQDVSEHGVHSVQWWSDERAARVQRLRARVQAGTYRVDSVALAERMLDAAESCEGLQ